MQGCQPPRLQVISGVVEPKFSRTQLMEHQSSGGGYSWEFFVGVCRPVLQILTRFQTRTLKPIPVFRPGLWTEIMSSLLRLEHKHKNYSNPFRICIFLFLSFFLIWNWNDKYNYTLRSSLENLARFQTKLAQKPYPVGWHIPIWLI